VTLPEQPRCTVVRGIAGYWLRAELNGGWAPRLDKFIVQGMSRQRKHAMPHCLVWTANNRRVELSNCWDAGRPWCGQSQFSVTKRRDLVCEFRPRTHSTFLCGNLYTENQLRLLLDIQPSRFRVLNGPSTDGCGLW